MANAQTGSDMTDFVYDTHEVEGDVVFPAEWVVFAPLTAGEPLPDGIFAAGLPESIEMGGKVLSPRRVRPNRCQHDFADFFGPAHDPATFGKAALVYVVFDSPTEGAVTLGFGADYRFRAWFNGSELAETEERPIPSWPPAITDQLVTARLRVGRNILAVYFEGGKGSSLLALGGPLDLRRGDVRSIRSDPSEYDPRWREAGVRTAPRGKEVVTIGSRRELLVDDFLFDDLASGAHLRLHQPQHRDVVLTLDQEWEYPLCRYFTLIEADDRVRLYYMAKPSAERARIEGIEMRCMTCLAESRDGLNFERVRTGLHEFNGSKDNNIIWRGRGGHNLTPFRDTSPNCREDQRYKAVADYPEGLALGAYVSADGLNWSLLGDRPILTQGGFDSQNLAFWDPNRGCYVCYYRDNTGGLRRVFRSCSDDFVNWSDGEELVYADRRQEHFYTNCIRPHPTAPHIYTGTPLRFITHRTKLADHRMGGLGDGVFMSSRDGLHFNRWEQSFIAPNSNPGNWTERKNEPAWGMLQTSPEELSIYWREMDIEDHIVRLRRGVLRTDGFVSLHRHIDAVGEALTRPFIFSGSQLFLNYVTSAVGTLRIGICDEAGRSLPGYSMADSEILFGNELAYACRWLAGSDISHLAGTPIRLKIRLHDADLYSLQFL